MFYLYVYVPCAQCPGRPEEGIRPWNWSHRWLWATILVLGIEPVSSRRAINVLNPWPISLALVSFCTMVLALPQSGYHESCSSCIYSLSPNSKGIPFSWDGICSLMKVPFFIIWEVHAVCSDNICLPPLPQLFHSHSMYSLLSPVCTAQIGVRLSTNWLSLRTHQLPIAPQLWGALLMGSPLFDVDQLDLEYV